MSVPAALTAIMIILAVIAAMLVAVSVLAAILLVRLLRLQRMLVAEAAHVRERLRATVSEMGETTRTMTSTVGAWGTGARYAGLAAEAAAALLAWRQRATSRPAPSNRGSRSRIIAWAVTTGLVALQVWRRVRRSRGPSHDSAG